MCETQMDCRLLTIKKQAGTFTMLNKALVTLEGKSPEKSIFAVTSDGTVLAYSERSHALYAFPTNDPDHDFNHICSFDLPNPTKEAKSLSYSACLNPPNTHILFMVALDHVMFLLKFELKTGSLRRLTYSEHLDTHRPIPIAKAKQIACLSDSQLLVQTNCEVVIFDWVLNQK